MIDRKNKLLLTAFLILVAVSVVVSYARFVVMKDFPIFTPATGEAIETQSDGV